MAQIIWSKFAMFLMARGVANNISPTEVKSLLLIFSIFDAINFQYFLEMLEIMLQHSRKMLEIHCIKNDRGQYLT